LQLTLHCAPSAGITPQVRRVGVGSGAISAGFRQLPCLSPTMLSLDEADVSSSLAVSSVARVL
jgi:hypothetical protein